MDRNAVPRVMLPGARGPVVAGLGLLLLSEVLVFWGPIVRSETLAERDLAAYARPLRSLVKPLWDAAQGLPLWNPFFGSGQPFAANPANGLFHPLTALFLLFPFETAFRAQLLIPPLVGGLGAFFLARTLRRSVAAATLAGVAWGFGGYLLSAVNLLAILLAASVVPTVLAFAIRCGREGRSRDVAGVAASVGLVGLAAEPSTLLMLPVLVAAGLLHDRHRARRGERALPGASALALGLLLGIGLAAAALVPGAHHASKTGRAEGLPAFEANLWSMPAARALELLSPNVLGHVGERGGDEGWYWGAGGYPGRRSPFIYSLYPGLVVSIAAAVGAIVGWRRLWPWLLAGGVGLLLALGSHGPLWDLVRRLPLFSGIRYPEKFILLFCLPLVVVAAHGFDWIARSRGRPRKIAVCGLLAALGVALVATGILLLGDRLPVKPWRDLGVSPSIEGTFASVAGTDALRVGLVSLGGLLALQLLRRSRRLGLVALVLWTTADLVQAGRVLVPSVPVEKVLRIPDVVKRLVERPPSGPLFHLAAEDRERPLSRGLMKPPIPAQWGLAMTLERDVDLTALRWTAHARELFWRAVRKRPAVMPLLLERRGVGAILKFTPGVRVSDGRLAGASSTTGPLEVAIPARPRPLAFAVTRVVSLADDDSWADAVVGLADEIPVTACVGMEDARGLPQRPSPAAVAVVDRRPGWVVLDVDAAGPLPSIVAVNQSWDGGWSAFVDGVPARLLRVDVALSGLSVPSGRHRVSLVYSDPWVTGGLVTSFTALLMLFLVLLGPSRPFPGPGPRTDRRPGEQDPTIASS